jgi:hypothetical protein
VSSIVHIPLTKEEILPALEKALQQNFIDNLRNRHPNVALDSKLRGYVGELAFKKWAKFHEIEFKQSNIKDCSSGMDIDFVFETSSKKVDIELKTSLIPDVDQDLKEMVRRRDVKLIRRQEKTIEQLDADLHVQLVFKQLRMRKDDWLKKQAIDLSSFSGTNSAELVEELEDRKMNLEKIYKQLAAYRYKTDTFLMGWIDKPALIKQIHEKPQHLQKWKYGMREFWCCNLRDDAKKPLTLIEYLKTNP